MPARSPQEFLRPIWARLQNRSGCWYCQQKEWRTSLPRRWRVGCSVNERQEHQISTKHDWAENFRSRIAREFKSIGRPPSTHSRVSFGSGLNSRRPGYRDLPDSQFRNLEGEIGGSWRYECKLSLPGVIQAACEAPLLALPFAPIAFGGAEHGFGGFVQPVAGAFGQVALDCGNRVGRAEMDVGGLPAHGIEQAFLVAARGERSKLDARAVRREAAQQPAVIGAHE